MQLKEHLLEISFVVLIIRSLVFEAGLGEALVIMALIGALTYKKFLSIKNLDDKEDIENQLEDIKNQLQGLKLNQGIIRKTSLPVLTNNEDSTKRRF